MREGYEECRDCFMRKAAEEGRICECGRLKKAEFPTCYECFTTSAASEGKVCACGKFKNPRYEKCRACDGKGPELT